MAVRDDFSAGEVLSAGDLNDTFASKLDLAGGKILQIVRATTATPASTTSSSYVDTGFSITITPQKTDSTIIVIANFRIEVLSNNTDDTLQHYVGFLLTDSDDNNLSGGQGIYGWRRFTLLNSAGINSNHAGVATLMGQDTPATLAAKTYKVRFRQFTADVTAEFIAGSGLNRAQMFAIEVSA